MGRKKQKKAPRKKKPAEQEGFQFAREDNKKDGQRGKPRGKLERSNSGRKSGKHASRNAHKRDTASPRKRDSKQHQPNASDEPAEVLGASTAPVSLSTNILGLKFMQRGEALANSSNASNAEVSEQATSSLGHDYSEHLVMVSSYAEIDEAADTGNRMSFGKYNPRIEQQMVKAKAKNARRKASKVLSEEDDSVVVRKAPKLASTSPS